MNRLPDYFPDVPKSGGPVQYYNLVGPLAEALRNQDWDQPLPPRAVERLTKLLNEHERGTERRAGRDEAFLSYSARGGREAAPGDVRYLRKRWAEVHRVFVSLTHLGATLRDAEQGRGARRGGAHGPGAFAAVAVARGARITQLDRDVRELALLSASPTAADARAAQNLVREELQPAFFAAATPAWLPLLDADGWFENPPPPVHEDGWVSFPSWPQATYLVRVAAERPTETLAVIRRHAHTENEPDSV